MKIMFIGLGLIGGSMALALEGYPNLERYAVDGDEPTRLEALGRGVVRAAWSRSDDAPIEDMDIVVLCLHPEAAADFIRKQAGRIKPGALLTDVCGVKRPLREAVAEIARRSSHGGTGTRRLCSRDGRPLPRCALHPDAG